MITPAADNLIEFMYKNSRYIMKNNSLYVQVFDMDEVEYRERCATWGGANNVPAPNMEEPCLHLVLKCHPPTGIVVCDTCDEIMDKEKAKNWLEECK